MSPNPGNEISAARINLIILLLLALNPLIGMGIDLIAPSLPAISQDLQVSNTISKNLIAIYLFGYGLGNFLIGFLSDALGRRKLLLASLFMFTLTSLLPIFIPNTLTLLVSRLLQGFSLAGYGVVARATMSDLLTADRLKRIAVLSATMWGIGPVIGPVIGGYLQFYFGWQACFYFFAIYSFLGLSASIFILRETHNKRQSFSLKQIKHNLTTLVTQPLFMGMVIVMGTLYSLLIVFNALGPFLVQGQLGRSSVYFGHIALCMGFVFLAGTFVCRYLITKFQPEKILLVGVHTFFLVAIISLVFAYMDGKNIWVIVIPSLLLYFACGILYPAGMARSLVLFRHMAGSSAAVMNLLIMSITGLIALLMSFISPTSMVPIAWIYLGILGLSGLAYWGLIHKNKK